MKIKGKLVMSYVMIAVLVLVVGGGAIFGMATIQDNARLLYHNRVEPLGAMTEIIQTGENLRVQVLEGIAEENTARGEDAVVAIDTMNSLLENYGQFQLREQEQGIYDQLLLEWDTYSSQARTNARMIAAGQFDSAATSDSAMANDFVAFRETLYELRDVSLAIAEGNFNDGEAAFSTVRLITIAVAVFAVVLAIALGLLMGRHVGNPLKKVTDRLTLIAQGDLTHEDMHTKRKDEVGQLVDVTNMMQEDLQAVIRSVSGAAERLTGASAGLTQSSRDVREGSEQIASTMQELSSGSETQANTVATLSEKMEEFLNKIEEANKRTEDVSNDSTKVIEQTANGYKMMESALNQMITIDGIVNDAVQKVAGLEKRSGEVSKLVTVIQDIAEQTNLLALNAAIEAARAGEHGAGFAVVADEVRKLAEDVSNSVREITAIIQGIQTDTKEVVGALESGYGEVNTGTVQMAQTGQNFNEINEAIKKMVEKIEYVTSTLSGISADSVEINTSIEEIASVAEESAAGIEETAASSEEAASSMEEISTSADTLSELAENLNQEVSHFKTLA